MGVSEAMPIISELIRASTVASLLESVVASREMLPLLNESNYQMGVRRNDFKNRKVFGDDADRVRKWRILERELSRFGL